mgnify:CR=1 FL=1
MTHIQEKETQIKKNFKKVLNQKTITKGELLSLKKQTKALVDMEINFKPFLSKLTTQINGMKNGKLNNERKEKITNLVNEYLNTTIK